MPVHGDYSHHCGCNKGSSGAGFCPTCHVTCRKHTYWFHGKNEGCRECKIEDERKEKEAREEKDKKRKDKEDQDKKDEDDFWGIKGGKKGVTR